MPSFEKLMLKPAWLLLAFDADTSRRTSTEVVVSAPPLIVSQFAIGGGVFVGVAVGKGVAVKVPLAQLAESKEKVRSALNRATHKARRAVATASDEKFLYVWNED